MAENDIYNNEKKYNYLKDNIRNYLKPAIGKDGIRGKRKYWIKNKINLKYFEALFRKFDSRDTSYIRRIRLSRVFLIVGHVLKKDIAKATREDIDYVMSFAHTVNKSPKSKMDFVIDIKFIWRQLFPEKDEKGRIDETITPYSVRHLKHKVDKSKEKRRKDKLTFEEFERLVQYFADDAQMQFYLVFANESLVRPQEACYIRLNDVELHDNYAKVYLSEHGKEGVNGFLRCIDSFPYLLKWLEKHPCGKDKDSFLFVTEGNKSKAEQQKPTNVNKKIGKACQKLGISKTVTAYSLKRNGVSFKRLAGYSDAEIQHIARWTSTQQLKTYDLTVADDTFKIALMRKGLIKVDERHKSIMPELKKCSFCGKQNAFTNVACINCKRPLDREAVLEGEKRKEMEINELKTQLEELKEMVVRMAKKEIEVKVGV